LIVAYEMVVAAKDFRMTVKASCNAVF